MEAPEKQVPAATQYGCKNCNDRRFYIMLQPNGDIEVFCTLNNHRQTLVNIEKLVRSIFDDTNDSTSDNSYSNSRIDDPSFNS